jgi:hypothetical protein
MVEDKPEVYYVDGSTIRWIPTQQEVFDEFGTGAYSQVTTVPSRAALDNLIPRGLFGIPGISGGGTISFGNQQIQGSIWLWLGLAALAAYFLLRR